MVYQSTDSRNESGHVTNNNSILVPTYGMLTIITSPILHSGKLWLGEVS